MLTFGPLSSLFDFVIFAILLWVLHAGHAEFQTGWFIETLATQILVVFVIRTHASPFWRSRPGPALIAAALAGVAAAILLPYTPPADPLGFTRLPASYPPIVATLVVAYLALVEATKRALFTPGDLLRPAPPPAPRAVRHVLCPRRPVYHHSPTPPPSTPNRSPPGSAARTLTPLLGQRPAATVLIAAGTAGALPAALTRDQRPVMAAAAAPGKAGSRRRQQCAPDAPRRFPRRAIKR